jgi:TolA-binding protein
MAFRFLLGLILLLASSNLFGQGSWPLQASPAFGNENTFSDRISARFVLSGKVVTGYGTPPPERVAIQRDCDGQVHTETYTDSSGSFVLDPYSGGQLAGADEAGMTPVSTSGDLSWAGWKNCDLRAYLSGYSSSAIRLAGTVNDSGVVNVGTIGLHRLVSSSGPTVSVTSLAAPDKARKDFDKGWQEEKKGRWAAAREKFKKAIARYPKFALAWFELGRIQAQEKDTVGARESFREALTADSKLLGPYAELAQLALREQSWQELADTTDRLLEINSTDYPQFWYFNSIAYYNLHRFDQAEKSVLRGLNFDSQHAFPRMEYVLGSILARRRDYRSAALHLRNYLQLAPNATDAAEAQKLLAECETRSASASVQK